jgi:hypothetical protein
MVPLLANAPGANLSRAQQLCQVMALSSRRQARPLDVVRLAAACMGIPPAGVLLMLGLALPAQADSGYVHRTTAVARPSGLMLEAGRPDRLDFNFSDVKAWLLPSGDWRVEGKVAHKGALCGTYELGLRFGVGSHGCTEVEWLTQPTYATNQRQCNSATEFHVGGESQPELREHYTRISCAERLIRCSGNCK